MDRTVNFKIISNKPLTDSVFKMVLEGNTEFITAPGQFVNVQIDGLYLRRPISVCNVEGDKLTLIYKVVGKGTERMSEMTVGEQLNLLTGLGNGYNLSLAGAKPVLIGGGVGVPPLYLLAKRLGGKGVSVVLGFNTAKEVFYEEEFKALGCDVKVTTVDGSYGIKGFVTDALDSEYTHFYACGPYPMLRAVAAKLPHGSVSLEERMGCGYGACMGCSIVTKSGTKRVCKEGPVFSSKDIIW